MVRIHVGVPEPALGWHFVSLGLVNFMQQCINMHYNITVLCQGYIPLHFNNYTLNVLMTPCTYTIGASGGSSSS